MIIGAVGWGGSESACQYFSEVMADEPVGYWRHEAGALAVDVSGNGNHATTTTDVAEVAGVACGGGAGDYNGTTSYQEVPNSASIQDLILADGTFITVEARIDIPVLGANAHALLTKGWWGDVSAAGGWNIRILNDGAVEYDINFTGHEIQAKTTTFPVIAGQENHIIVACNKDHLSPQQQMILVNGVAQPITIYEPAGGTTFSDAAYPLRIGRMYYGLSPTYINYFNGAMDEVVLYNKRLDYRRALVHAQSAGFTVAPSAFIAGCLASGPVALYPHEAGIVRIDHSDNANDCTTTTAVTDTTGQDGGAGSYDGTTSFQSAPNITPTQDLALGSNVMTIETIISVASLANYRMIAAKGRITHEGWNSYIDITTGRLFMEVCYSSTAGSFRSGTGLSINTFYHIVIVVQGDATNSSGIRKMYINNVAETIVHVTSPVGSQGSDAAYAFKLGTRSNAGDANQFFFSGKEDTVALYNRELSAAEVAAHFALTGL